MIKKKLLIALLSVSMTAVVVTTAYSLVFSGFSLNILGRGSYELNAAALLKGIGFCLEGECAQVSVALASNVVQCGCMNNGGNCGGLGNPFFPEDTISGDDVIGAGEVYGTGKATAEICWHSDFITYIISNSKEVPPDYCDQNDNWGLCDCVLTQLDATFYGCAYDKSGLWLVQEATLKDCKIDPADLPVTIGETLYYSCKPAAIVKHKVSDQIPCPPGASGTVFYNENGCITLP